MIIGAASSMDFQNAKVGSTLIIDSLTFKGVTLQPALMNGDFEQWTENSIEKVNDWYTQNQNDDVVKKTADAYRGNFAIELKTYMGEENEQPKAQAGQLMTGYYPDCSTENCEPLGGYPFTNQSDVLEFYYKYASVGNDVATVNLYFKNKTGMKGWYGYTQLPASDTYKYVAIPFALSFVPDSVIIQIQSSEWSTLTSANIGSTLKIDDMHFLSQPLGMNNNLTKEIILYPNPTEQGFYLNGDLDIETVTIINLLGIEVLKSNNKNYIDVSGLQKGSYMVIIQSKNGIHKSKLIKH